MDAVPLRQELVASLITSGALRDPGSTAAFAKVPRHLLVLRLYCRSEQDGTFEILGRDNPGSRKRWLRMACADSALPTQIADAAVSSAWQPPLMAGMLDCTGRRTPDGRRSAWTPQPPHTAS